ncbi:MAG: hypothetical protein O0V67_01605 [Methanocorpusculum sp.]|nr:hypothetical protein [Methanocorpusculum sp.]
MSDITLKVKVKYSAGEWVASTPVYDITGTGNTPEIALENFVSALEELYSGDKFLTANNRPVEISHMITGVAADVYLTVKMDRPLSDFGIEVAEEPELQTTLEGQEILTLPEPVGSPVMISTCADCTLFVWPDEGSSVGACSGYDPVRPRCPTDPACRDFYPRESGEQTDEEEETPSSKNPEGDPFELAYGISLDRYAIERISDERQRFIILPSKSDITPGVRILVYEKADAKGRKAYVGEFVAGEIFRIERGDSEATEWMHKLHINHELFEALFGTQLYRFVLMITNYQEYAEPIAIPDGLKAPRGVNWIPPFHLSTLLPESKGRCPFRVDTA